MKRTIATLAGVIALAMAGAAPAAPKGFSDWAAVVVSGDYLGGRGGQTETFDNARRDIAKTLVDRMGFKPGNVKQYSVRPDRYQDTKPGRSTLFNIQNGLLGLAGKAKGGCLFYFTSHGAKHGAFLNAEKEQDQQIIFPTVMAELVNSACPDRPTIVVISTCFSGVNVPHLQKADRLVMTAARRDRSSFGCGENSVYPYFDQCFLEEARTAPDFVVLANAVSACVSRMEQETGMAPPSEPQIWIGDGIKPLLPLYAFPKGG
ncbi:MAG TPA: C13 family peptidase [Caulobacter sp.]|nr:C13 family peptidase [Caulobacter sp.]